MNRPGSKASGSTEQELESFDTIIDQVSTGIKHLLAGRKGEALIWFGSALQRAGNKATGDRRQRLHDLADQCRDHSSLTHKREIRQ